MQFTKPISLSSKMYFGKYKGETIEDIIENDPQYVDWCLENVKHFSLNDEAEELLNSIERGYNEYGGYASGSSIRRNYQEVDYDYDDQFLWTDPLNF